MTWLRGFVAWWASWFRRKEDHELPESDRVPEGEAGMEPEPDVDEDPTLPDIVPEDPTMSIISPDTKRVIQSILSVFETGKPEGAYDAVTVLSDGAGISYGKHQATDKSDTLDAIVYRYLDLGGVYAKELRSYLDRLESDATASQDPSNLEPWVTSLMELLATAARKDAKMRVAQDQIFDELYWRPAADQALAMKLELPLSWLVCYDTTIHSGPGGITRIRKLFPERPPSAGGDEKAWVVAYLYARRGWLLEHPNPVVQATVYRIDAMLDLVDAANWELATPIQISKPRAVVE
jgi:chitosanase